MMMEECVENAHLKIVVNYGYKVKYLLENCKISFRLFCRCQSITVIEVSEEAIDATVSGVVIVAQSDITAGVATIPRSLETAVVKILVTYR